MNNDEHVNCPTCDEHRDDPHYLMTHSGVAADGYRPFVHVAHGTALRGQMSPAETRQYALRLLAAADAAESDALIVRLLTQGIGIPLGVVAQLLLDLRGMRHRDDGDDSQST